MNKILFIGIALIFAVVFFLHIKFLWPFVEFNFKCDKELLVEKARRFLDRLGFNTKEYLFKVFITYSEKELRYIEYKFGRSKALFLIKNGLPIYKYLVLGKKKGSNKIIKVYLNKFSICGFSIKIDTDNSDNSENSINHINLEQAKQRALKYIKEICNLSLMHEDLVGLAWEKLPDRIDYVLEYEKKLFSSLKLRIKLKFCGEKLTEFKQFLHIESRFKKKLKLKELPYKILYNLGMTIVVIASLNSLFYFIIFLRKNQVSFSNLKLAGICIGIIFCFSFFINVLQESKIFRLWTPLWPYWLSIFQHLLYFSIYEIFFLFFIYTFIITGISFSCSTEVLKDKYNSLIKILKGKFFDYSILLACFHGLLIGLICGGTMYFAIFTLSLFSKVKIAVQPRGFFFYIINSSYPFLVIVIFFLKIAFIEELGYRFFGCSWLYKIFKKAWLAIVIPAIIYGLMHANMTFLPPESPAGARVLVMSLIGCIWGIAYFKFDILTVIVSHFISDLFIFSLPMILSLTNITQLIKMKM